MLCSKAKRKLITTIISMKWRTVSLKRKTATSKGREIHLRKTLKATRSLLINKWKKSML